MPASQAAAASERRNDRMTTHEPPKLKTTLKTPPKQATNPLQFVKVGPCSLYRTAQEQLQKVQEVKKIKQEVRDDPEDWQSNLDNWKSSRRKRQEHIIERVVEVKKLELEEHDRQRRRSKTFSEMMEERGNRGRKLSISLAMYQEEDANDLSDLGIGTSSGKSSVSGDTHDDTHSVLSDRDSEIEKNHSDVDSNVAARENGNSSKVATKKSNFGSNGFHCSSNRSHQEYDSATTATASSPEPEEYTYEGAIRGYVSRVAQNIPRRSSSLLVNNLDGCTKSSPNEDSSKSSATTKSDVLKRREIFEKASQKGGTDTKANRLSGDFANAKTIKERLSNLEKQKQYETTTMMSADNSLEKNGGGKALNRLSGDMSSIRERLSLLEKQTSERESKNSARKQQLSTEELETVRPLRERLSTLEKYSSSEESSVLGTNHEQQQQPPRHNGELTAKSIKDRLSALDAAARSKEVEKRCVGAKQHELCCFGRDAETRIDTSTPSERSSSPDSEYRVPRAAFHRSLDSLDADASSGPDTFERVQSLEELDYTRRYQASFSSAELLNDTDREDSGIHTGDVSCSVSQADEPVDEEIVMQSTTIVERHEVMMIDEKPEFTHVSEVVVNVREKIEETKKSNASDTSTALNNGRPAEAVVTKKEPLVVDKSIIEESIREVTLLEESQIVRGPINMELELTTQNNNNLMKKKKKKDEGSRTMVVEVEDRREPINTLVDHLSPSTPERPSTLTFEKSTPTFTTMEILSPLSPMSKQILPLNLSSDEEIVTGLAFPLGPPTSAEPPKEKPPPPPVDLSDEENLPTESLKRLNSTRRIKKEIRSRRSDFLGIEGINDDELEREMTLTKPPDMAAILAEERRIEQLHRRSYDTDSNYEQDSSHERDSGVELGHAEDWTKQAVSPDMSQHSRQSSEPFGASVTSSEEDEITKKEKEIIEVLEKEEQWRYANNRELDSSDIGEKLAHKLRELEEEKMQLERERAQEMELRRQEVDTLRKNEENIRKQEEMLRQQQEEVARQQEVARADAERQAEARRLEEKKRQEELRIQSEIEEKERRAADVRHQEEIRIRAIENQIREQENKAMVGAGLNNCEGEFASGEVLRVERELLQLEQEELKRQRNNLAYREHKQQQLAEQLQEQWKSLQDVAHGSTSNVQQQFKQQPPPMNYRSSMPNLQLQDGQRRRPPPPPIPPAKPLRLVEQRQRDVTIRNSRVPSADSIPQQVDASLRHSTSATALATTHGGQQMTRQTLQALSAAPRPRIVQGDQWVQRRKSDVPRSAQDFNYQHWLIQEAEQRRINEKNQRSPRKVHVTGTSVPYTASPPRSDSKPLPDSIIQTLTQRVQNRTQEKPLPLRRRLEQSTSQEHLPPVQQQQQQHIIQQQKVLQSSAANNVDSQEKMLSVSGKNKCSHCGDELGRGAAMIIECLRLFYHMECFKCCVCHVRLGDGLMGTDVRVRNHKLHCHNCYSSDDGVKFSCV